MSSNNRYLIVAFNFHNMHMFISTPSLPVCLIRYPQILMGTMAAIFGYHPPAYSTVQTVVTRCFSSSIPNPWYSHQQLAIIKSAGRHSRLTCLCQIRQMCPAFPHPDREHRKNVYFLKFFLEPGLLIIPYFAQR